MPPKRFLLFANKAHNARGGWHDFVGSYDWPVAAEEAFASHRVGLTNDPPDFGHIIDTTTGFVVRCWGGYDDFGEPRRRWHEPVKHDWPVGRGRPEQFKRSAGDAA